MVAEHFARPIGAHVINNHDQVYCVRLRLQCFQALLEERLTIASDDHGANPV